MSLLWFAALLMHVAIVSLILVAWRPLRSGTGPTPIETALGVTLLATNIWFAWMNLT